jgi:hypothetical protein
MTRRIVLVTLAAMSAAPAGAQEAEDVDVATMDGIIDALYASISGPAGEDRDWDRFQSLFLPGAILMNAGPRADTMPDPAPLSPAEYGNLAAPYFAENPFYEVESDRLELRFGTVATLWSTYESRRDPGDEPFMRGINSITMIRHEDRWWIVGVIWDFERPDNPIPAEYGG